MTAPHEADLVKMARALGGRAGQAVPGMVLRHTGTGRLIEVLIAGREVVTERRLERGRTNRVGVRWVAFLPNGDRAPGRWETRQGALAAAVAELTLRHREAR